MVRPISSGTLLYRLDGDGVSVLIVHPSGNYNRRAPWSIPKGLTDDGESLEAAARRETLEETGVVCGELVPLGSVDYTRSRKTVHCFAGRLPASANPTCASWEVDQVEVAPTKLALERLQRDQQVFVERLLDHLTRSGEEA